MADDEPTLSDRITRLERHNRTLMFAFVATVLVALVAAAGTRDITRASAFQLTDEDGKVRAELAMNDGTVGLFLKDVDGRDRLSATHDAEGTGLFVYDDVGTTRIGIAQFAHGGGGVALHGPESKGAAVLYLKGQGSLRFFDADGKVTNQIRALTEGHDD